MNPVLIFGASGSLGMSILHHLRGDGIEVVGLSRNTKDADFLSLDDKKWFEKLSNHARPYSVVFAQGANVNDNVYAPSELRSTLEANVVFVVENLSQLLNYGLVGKSSNVVILSSIWQEISRPNKMSYSVAKSALKGLVGSLVADLSKQGIRVNAVLPGVVDTPMTRSMLSNDDIARIKSETPLGDLVGDLDVARTVAWLLSDFSTGVTGQFIRVDNGWTNVKLYP